MSKNVAPVAILTASKEEITLPENKVVLSLEESYDLNPNRGITSYQIKNVNTGTFVALKIWEVILPEGTHTFQGTVWDKQGKMGTAAIDIVVKPAVIPAIQTKFGAKITNGTFEQQDKALTALGSKFTRPNAITLSTWKEGDTGRVDDFLNAGYTCLLNVNWEEATQNTIIPFCKDLKAYADKFEAVVKQYLSWVEQGKLIFVMENEECNRGYYSGPIEDYITLLNIAVGIAQKYKVPIADGSIAIELCTAIAENNIPRRNQEQADKVKKLVAAFAAITYDNFYVNVHTKGDGVTYDSGDIPLACDWIRDNTGKQVLSNEWHMENAQPSLVYDMVALWRKAAVLYSLNWDESKEQGGAITDGNGSLTKLGTALADAIK